MPPKHSDHLRLRYFHGGAATYLPGETFGPRTIRDYELVWITSGVVKYHQDGRPYAAPPGSVILARPGFRELYEWDPDRTTRHAFFHFSPTCLPVDWPTPGHWPICRAFRPGAVVLSIFQHLIEQWRSRQNPVRTPSRSTERMVEALLDSFIHEPQPSARTQSTRHPEPIRRALEWMNRMVTDEPQTHLTLNEVAQAALVSPKHLCRLFSAHLGVTPMEALRLLRLEQAVALLTRSNLNIKQIAARCGFASPYHFSRCFSEVYGSPPSEVHRNLMVGSPPPIGPIMLNLREEGA